MLDEPGNSPVVRRLRFVIGSGDRTMAEDEGLNGFDRMFEVAGRLDRVAVEFKPAQAGRFTLHHCSMSVVRGALVVKPA